MNTTIQFSKNAPKQVYGSISLIIIILMLSSLCMTESSCFGQILTASAEKTLRNQHSEEINYSIPEPGEENLNDTSVSPLIKNGWYQQDQKVIWGFYHNSSFWGGLRTDKTKWYSVAKVEGPNITRRDPGKVGPLLTEDLDSLSSSLKKYGFPGLIHHYGLWYDRRRDAHDLGQRQDANVVPPFLEMPWARSDSGKASDGLPRYDLTKFNPWYFERLVEFARLCDEKGLIFFFNFYQQHMLIESKAHYEDFPWRPCNNIQNIDLPDHTPAADEFYAVATPLQRKLHLLYIKKCLDELSPFRNVVFCLSQEYTGPKAFVEFWLDAIKDWENENGFKVNIALGATKDVTDDILADPARAEMIGTIDMSRWWYDRDGTLFAPPGGMDVPGRYMGRASNTSPEQIYHLVNEYRSRYPSMALLHSFSGYHQQILAFLMAGGSMLMADFSYPDAPPPEDSYAPPANYIPPTRWSIIKSAYEFINTYLGESLLRMSPNHYIVANPENTWALGDTDREYIIYSLHGGTITFGLPRTQEAFVARWLNPRSGEICQVKDAVKTGQTIKLSPPSGADNDEDWLLWLVREQHMNKKTDMRPFPLCGNITAAAPKPVVSKKVENEVTPVTVPASPECFHHDIGAMVKINFQPAGIVPPEGYIEDNGELYGKRNELRYGWLTDHTDRMLRKYQMEPARRKPDIRLGTLCDVKADAVWEIEVENGDYLVEITAGDPSFPSYCTVEVEGLVYWDANSLYTNEFATLSYRISVTDGKLTISAQGGQEHSTKLSSLTITAAAEP